MRFGEAMSARRGLPALDDLRYDRRPGWREWTTMRKIALVGLAALLTPLAGCGDGLQGVSTAADQARNASEHFATDNDAANRLREAKILADAATMEQKVRARAGLDSDRPRFQLKKDGLNDTWTVYDTLNGRAMKIDSKAQVGLSHDEAEATLGKLMKQEKQQDELFGRR